MALYIARHGQTDWNLQRRFQSTTDVPLNEHGRSQATALADLLNQRRITFSEIYSSPLQRAMSTAEILIAGATAARSTPTITAEPSFIELSLGEFEGRYADDLKNDFGDVFTVWQASGFIDAAPGGESMQQAVQRVTPVLTRIRRECIDADVLIVAHQGSNMAIKSALEGELSVERLVAHRQGNDEIDIWDERQSQLVERLKPADSV